MSFRIVQVEPRAVEAVAGVAVNWPVLAFAGVDGDQVVGIGGLTWGGGRCWLWFKMFQSEPRFAVPIIRKVRKLMAQAVQLGEAEIYTPREECATSRRLLEHLGFRLFAIEAGNEVWRWQN